MISDRPSTPTVRLHSDSDEFRKFAGNSACGVAVAEPILENILHIFLTRHSPQIYSRLPVLATIFGKTQRSIV